MGYALSDPHYDRKWAFVANWNWNAIILNKNVLVFSRVPNPLYGTRIYDRISYKELDASISNKYTKEIFDAMKQGKWFFK